MAEDAGERLLLKHSKIWPSLPILRTLIPLFGCLGIAFKFAERDYVAKVNDLAETANSISSLQILIDQDIQANTVRKQGSHTRNLLKVKRGLDMVKVLFEQIIVTEGSSFKDPASKAYTQVFAPYHGWAIRKAVGAGMYALPSRPQLMSKLNEGARQQREDDQGLQILWGKEDVTGQALLVFEMQFKLCVMLLLLQGYGACNFKQRMEKSQELHYFSLKDAVVQWAPSRARALDVPINYHLKLPWILLP